MANDNKKVRVLFMTRRPDKLKRLEFVARHLVNEREVIAALQHSLKATHDIVPVDFSSMSFKKQVLSAYDADILLGFHGAGSNHMFHMNSQREGCCGVIEVFPQRNTCEGEEDSNVCAMALREGHGNHARYLGYEFDMIVAEDDSFQRPPTDNKGRKKGGLGADHQAVKEECLCEKKRMASPSAPSSSPPIRAGCAIDDSPHPGRELELFAAPLPPKVAARLICCYDFAFRRVGRRRSCRPSDRRRGD